MRIRTQAQTFALRIESPDPGVKRVANGGTIPFYLDGDDEERGYPELALHAHGEGEPWNGLPSPHATADAFRSFLHHRQRNDPNGTWNPHGVREGDGTLRYDDEAGSEHFPVVGMSPDRKPLYNMSGWNWERKAMRRMAKGSGEWIHPDRRIADRDDRVPHGKLGDSDLVVRSAGVYAMTASPTGMFTA